MRARVSSRPASAYLIATFLAPAAFAGLVGCGAPPATTDGQEVTATSEQAAISCDTLPRDPLDLDSWTSFCGTAAPCTGTKVAIPGVTGDRCISACPPDYEKICPTTDPARCRCQWRASFTPAVTDVAAAATTSYARDMEGNVWAWGSGNGSTIPGRAEAQVPVALDVRGAIDIVAGDKSACVRTPSKDVTCWGTIIPAGGLSGVSAEWAKPQKVEGIAGAEGVTIGNGHACAWTEAGKVFCWGDADFGQTGDGLVDIDEDGFRIAIPGRSKETAQEVSGLADAVKVVASGLTTCALTRDGKIYCFGSNAAGGLGDGAGGGHASTPKLVDVGRTATALFGGGGTFCADFQGPNQRLCWGANENRQTASSLQAPVAGRPIPQDLLGTTALGDLYVGTGNVCQSSGLGLACWGNNAHGQLQRTPSFTPQVAAARLDGPRVVGHLAIGQGHICAASGGVRCWGNNSKSQVLDRDLAANSDAVVQPVYVRLWDKWPTGKVPICFDAATRRRPDFVARSREIKRRALSSWATVATVNFEGWGACPANTDGMIVLHVDDTAKSASCFGYQPKSACDVSLGTADPSWPTSLISNELGRALGVAYDGWIADRPATQGGADVAMDPRHIVHAQRMYGQRVDGVRMLRRIMIGQGYRTVGQSSDTVPGATRYVHPDGWILAMAAPKTVPLLAYYNAANDSYVVTTSLEALPNKTGYTSIGSEGHVYVYKAGEDPPRGTVPLKTFWNATKKKYLTTATATGAVRAAREGYTLARIEGHVFGDVPYAIAARYRHSDFGDNLMATFNSATGTTAEEKGYKLLALDGAIMKHPLPGTAALVNYWGEARKDHYATATAAGRSAATAAGYVAKPGEGYVFTASHIGAKEVKTFWHATPADNFTTLSPIGRTAADNANYSDVRVEGYAYELSRYTIMQSLQIPLSPPPL